MEGDSAVEKKVKKHVTQIVCVLCAIGLWSYVTYTEDPEMQVWVRNIPVSYIGAETLSEKGITFTEKEEPEEIHVKVSGRKSFLRRLRESDVHASVNYTGIAAAGEHVLPIQVTISQRDLWVTKLSQSTVECATDVSVTVEKTVSVSAKGAEEKGLRDFAPSPQTVRITGAKSTLEHVKPAVFLDFTEDAVGSTQKVTLLREDGKPYTGGDIKIETETVTISATRALPIEIEAANTPPGGEIREVVCEPDMAPVRGELDALLEAGPVRGAYKVWVDFSATPAQSGAVALVYPENVTPLGTTTARATFHVSE